MASTSTITKITPFKTAYQTKSTEAGYTPSGSKIVTEHREDIDISGKRRLIKDREINIYEKIQASAESCEIENILRRASEGDMSVLNMVNGNYIDITGAPASLAEAQQFVIRAKAQFDELPKEIKAKFDNNAEMYVAQYGTDEWEDKTGIKAAKELEKAKLESEKLFNKNMEEAFKNLAQKGELTNE